MVERNRGWLLPEEGYDALDTVCIKFEVPDSPEILRAARFAVQSLTYWSKWERDQDKRAAPLAHYLLQVIENSYTVDDCDMLSKSYDLRIEDCNLILTENGVEKTVIDLTTCAVPGPKGDQGDQGPIGPIGLPGQDCDCSDSTVPEPDGTGTICDVAHGVATQVYSDFLEITEDYILNVVNAGQNATEWLQSAMSRWSIGQAYVGAFFAIIHLFEAQGAMNVYNIVNDTGFFHDLKCALYCLLKANDTKSIGVDTPSQWMNKLREKQPNYGTNGIENYIQSLSLGELRLYAYIADQAAYGYQCDDCTDCQDNGCVEGCLPDYIELSVDPVDSRITVQGGYVASGDSGNPGFNATQNSDQIDITFPGKICLYQVEFWHYISSVGGWTYVDFYYDDVLVSEDFRVLSRVNYSGTASAWTNDTEETTGPVEVTKITIKRKLYSADGRGQFFRFRLKVCQ